MKLVIFGCGNIANRIAVGAKLVTNIDLVGFGSRDIEKAKSYCEKYGCKEYGNYDYFLNSDVDAVYIATYNLNHYQLIKECLTHHKNVICEKPMLSSLQENEELFILARENNVLLMEAMKSLFLPLTYGIKEMIDKGDIGQVRYIEATFVRAGHFDDKHWINDLKTGGALKDIGSYCASEMNYLIGKTPKVISRITDGNAKHSDRLADVQIDYDGIIGHLFVSNQIDGDSHVFISGDKGYLYASEFWKKDNLIYYSNGIKKEIKFEMINDFYYELLHFASLVDNKVIESDVVSKEVSDNILKITC